MNSKYLVSLLSFGAKGVCALLITYWLANSLGVEDYALWATVFSLGMVLSVADFGVGQLVLTTLHENGFADEANDRLMANAVASMTVMAAGLFLLASVTLASGDWLGGLRWQYLVVAVIVLRLVFIPFGAVLAALDRFHERKVIEAVSYAVAAIFILWCTRAKTDISVMLLGMNVILTLGSAAFGVRAAMLGATNVRLGLITYPEVRRVFASSAPYFVNNVSGLAIYGGFIALSALVLGVADTARLSLLHNLVFMHLYQAFELIFRTSQTRLQDEAMMGRLTTLVAVSYVGCVVSFGLVGVPLFRHFFGEYQYSVGELVVYASFAFLEIYYLLLTSRMQMVSSMKRALHSISLIKAVAFATTLAIFAAILARTGLVGYSLTLVGYSLSMAYAARIALKRGTAWN